MGVLATPLIHDVELNSDGTRHVRQSSESRALRSVLRNHAEGYALLCFNFYGIHITKKSRDSRGDIIIHSQGYHKVWVLILVRIGNGYEQLS